MPLVPLNIPKGQYANGTEYQSQGRWRDVNLVRWHEDALRPIGGWRPRAQSDNSLSRCRRCCSRRSLLGR
jgi:hypothetical protein